MRFSRRVRWVLFGLAHAGLGVAAGCSGPSRGTLIDWAAVTRSSSSSDCPLEVVVSPPLDGLPGDASLSGANGVPGFTVKQSPDNRGLLICSSRPAGPDLARDVDEFFAPVIGEGVCGKGVLMEWSRLLRCSEAGTGS